MNHIDKGILAPIVIFAYNRVAPLMKTIDSLRCCSEAINSDLYIFVDGSKENSEDEKKVSQVRNWVKNIYGFHSINTEFSSTNRGLGPSIIYGVSKIIKEYGKVIVVEDDLIVMPCFLSYMNQALDKYKSIHEIISVCGYSCRVQIPSDYKYDAYLFTRSSSWGWGTWQDRWLSIDWNLNDWEQVSKTKSDFNNICGSDCFGMLQNWKYGLNQSWAIRFCYSQFVQKKYSVHPIKSLVDNEGFDGSGTNCKRYNRFKFELDHESIKTFRFPEIKDFDKRIYKSAMRYHSLMRRIWSRIMYIIK